MSGQIKQEYECNTCESKKCILNVEFSYDDKPSFLYCPEFGMRCTWYLKNTVIPKDFFGERL